MAPPVALLTQTHLHDNPTSPIMEHYVDMSQSEGSGKEL